MTGRYRPHLSLREGLEQPPFPSRLIVPDRSSPSRVRFAASRPGLLRADPKDALLTRGKGGCGSASEFVSHLIAFDSIALQTVVLGPCGRAERNLSAIPDALSRSRGALSPAHPQGRSTA